MDVLFCFRLVFGCIATSLVAQTKTASNAADSNRCEDCNRYCVYDVCVCVSVRECAFVLSVSFMLDVVIAFKLWSISKDKCVQLAYRV